MKPLDREAMEVGSRIWGHTFGAGLSERESWDLVTDRRETGNQNMSAWDSEQLIGRLFGWAQWAHAGFPMLDIEEKYAAALMASDGAEAASEDVVVPWQHFHIRVPRGLLVDGDVCFDRIWFGRGLYLPGTEMASWVSWMRMMDSDSALEQAVAAPNLGTLLLGDQNNTASFAGNSEARQRCVKLARRLTIGALYTLQFTNNFRWHDRKLKKHIVGRNGPPTHRVAIVGRPIHVDCRSWVREYVATGKGKSPTVQSLVRGHYKRQVVGVSRSGRKVIWVEPYWRGPEDAPILVRPLRVGPSCP